MAKKTIFIRVADALLMGKDSPITAEDYQKLVKEMGLEKARNKKIAYEMEVP